MTYYIKENEKIVLHDTDRQRLADTLLFMPQYEGLEILETDGYVIDGKIIGQEEYAVMKIEQEKRQALATVDNSTSRAILAGFDYEVDGEELHFSYDSFDQQNFADTANMAMLTQSIADLPQTVVWNAYRNYSPSTGGELVRLDLDVASFLALYTGGALVHKASTMEQGGARKAQIEACETVEEIKNLLTEWGLAESNEAISQ